MNSEEVVEISASDVIGQFVGQSAPKMKKKLEEGLGRVLFLDEAYRLDPRKNGGNFCQESLDELVDCLTKPEFKGKLVVILAGYPDDITGLMSANSGLSSRFPESVEFESFSSEQCVRLLQKKVGEKEWNLDCKDDQRLLSFFEELRTTKNWGNGRDIGNIVERLVKESAKNVDLRTVKAGEHTPMPMEVVVSVLSKELEDRRKNSQIMTNHDLLRKMGQNLFPAADSTDEHTKTPPISVDVDVKTSKSGSDGTNENDENNNDEAAKLGLGPRDPGVTDEEWAALINAAKRKREEEEKNQKIQMELLRIAKEKAEAERKAQELEKQRKEEEAKKMREEAERKERERLQKEEEARRIREKIEFEAKLQEKIQRLGLCPAGYQWYNIGGGQWRCGGGSHVVAESQLNYH